MADKTSLIAQIDSVLPDNNLGEISPADIRSVLYEMVASGLNLEELAAQSDVGPLEFTTNPTILGVPVATEQDITDAVTIALDGNTTRITQEMSVNEGIGIAKGQLVYISGATLGTAQVSLADKTSFSTSDTIGIAQTSGLNGTMIDVVTLGIVTELNTSAFTEGEILYLGTAGTVTADHPVGTEAFVRIGHAVSIHATLGTILFEVESLTIIDDYDGLIRHTVVNENAGTSSAASNTMINDAGHRSSINMVGSNYNLIPGVADSFIMYNEGYNKSVFAVAGNYGFDWSVDVTNGHDLGFLPIMSLSPTGDLTLDGTVDGRDIDADGLVQDGHIADISRHVLDGGWNDLVGNFTAANAGGTSPPSWANPGNGMYAWLFTAGDEIFIDYHVRHDYKLGTVAYPHVHFFVNSTMTSGQTITWRFAYVIAKGHSQGESLTTVPINVDMIYTADGTEVAGEHIVLEASIGQAFDLLEPDSIIRARVELLSENATGSVFGSTADLHYQVDRTSTLNKAPNFYV
jgi:hypothetical protein